MTSQDNGFDREARQGDPLLVTEVPGGQLWENWRLEMEQKLHQVNNLNEDRALLEQALRE